MHVVQKDLIQRDKEMSQVKCERYYEWGSAPGKFLVRDPLGKDDVSPKLGIIVAQSILSLFILLL